MWFRFPKGAERISIERQEFVSEFVDGEGRHYFRAPGHFAARILHLGAGFAAVTDVPEGMPADLPREDPERDNAIASLTAQLVAKEDEIAGMRSDLIAMRQAKAAADAEVANLRSDMVRLNARVQELQDDLDDRGLMEAMPTEQVKPAPNGHKKA